MNADRRKWSGVDKPTRPTLAVEKAAEDGREVSSVLSVILLRRFFGSKGGTEGERGENVGRDTKEGEPEYEPE